MSLFTYCGITAHELDEMMKLCGIMKHNPRKKESFQTLLNTNNIDAEIASTSPSHCIDRRYYLRLGPKHDVFLPM
jgi:hypothetical protein